LLAGGPTSIITASYAATDQTIAYPITDATAQANFIAGLAGRPYTVSGDTVRITYTAGSNYINSTNYIYAGDTAYVNLRSFSLATGGTSATDVNWYASSAALAAGVVASTGSYQVRPISDQEILTYHEMCFIKAEAYMRKGDAGNAYTAYLAGIQAHINMMQAKLTSWQGIYTNNPDMAPMDQTAISTYLSSNAV
jgi:predicted dehydrogenase